MKKRKKMPKRMLAIAAMVDDTKTLADVGCDHAYISINLLEKGKVERIIASDLREGPLNIAKENIRLSGFEDKIETRLCPGLEGYKEGEINTILISGMGGMLIREILSERKEVVETADTLILEPQSDLRVVRSYLREVDFKIVDEDMIKETGKFYQIIKAVRSELGEKSDNSTKTMVEDEFGPILISKKHKVLEEFLFNRKKHFETLLENKEFIQSQKDSSNDRIKVITQELEMVLEALNSF